jgi:WD40 repeat protein/tRNA A-37 threonylcarbamoyl transferase component Bud32
VKADDRRACLVCGTWLAAGAGFCPVCRLRGALEREGDAGEPGSLSAPLESTLELSPQRFERYELLKGQDGRPIQLGRGAMGITYKAFDVDLHRPVTLKVIRERYLGDESAKLRFLREARAAARVRHSNVASVFHLGRSGGNYFYAMEFVEGDTLERLIKGRGRLEVTLALEITRQVTAGLSAVHKQKLVHRDIKPANVMVSLEEGGGVTAKVIDLGLAKPVRESPSEAAISRPGAFAGTPAFASPEQFAGVGVDIRSDLYSLGVTLWEMLTGQPPFRGTPAELMHQHLHRPLPLQELQHVPQPVVSLLTSLLEKDPARRPQNPSELNTLLCQVRAALEPKAPVEARGVLRAAEPERAQALDRDNPDRKGAPVQAAPCGETPGRSWRPPAEPSPDFTPFLVTKLKGFTGRQWLFQEIAEWLAKGCQPALLIVGEPGIGKSSMVAALVHENPGGHVLAYHCCRADTPATLEPARFVRGLAAKLSIKLNEYAAMMADSVVATALQLADADPADGFENAILDPLHRIREPGQGRCYLLIDGLDEALTRVQRPTIVEVLSTRLSLLPPWLRIVATTRGELAVLRQLGGLRAHTLNAQDPRNQDDVRRFIRRRLAEPALRDKVQVQANAPGTLEGDLLKASGGNFLFITTALDAVESGQLSFEQIGKLPPGLGSLYELFFDRLFRDAGVDFHSSHRVLQTLAAAGERLTREQLAAITGLDAEAELPPILVRLASFVPAIDGRYAFFHLSLVDWLTSWDTQLDRPVAGLYHVSLKKGHRQLADWCWAAYKRDPLKLPLYCLRHLPRHLYQADRIDEARTALLDFNFLQAKLEANDVSEVLTDYKYLANETDLRLVQSALRLSAHVLPRDARQLAGQLTGRLLGSMTPAINTLLKQAAGKQTWPWLRPLRPGLTPPGGPLVAVLEGHKHEVTAVAVMPEGCRAVSGSGDRTLRLWDLESGRTLLIFQGHVGAVRAVTVTPDGRCILSGGNDRTLRVWDVESGRAMATLTGHTGAVRAVVVTPDGRRAVSGSDDRTLRVWDVETGHILRTLEGHTGGVTAVTLTPDGRSVISASDDRTLRVWDLETGRTQGTLEGPTGSLSAVAVTPEGRHAVSASGSGHLCDGRLRVWDLESGYAIGTLEGCRGYVASVAITPEGRRVVAASYDGMLRVWDLESGQVVGMLRGHRSYVAAVAVTPEGRRAVSGSGDGTLRVWDLEKSGAAHDLKCHTLAIRAVVITPEGCRAVSGSGDGTLRVWDLGTGQIVCRLAGHRGRVTAVAVTPEARRAVSASDDRTLRVWDLESGHTLRTLEGHTSYVAAVAVTPEGRRVVSASYDRTLRVWDLESGHTLRTLEGHTNAVRAVAVTPDGRRAVSGSDDRTLRVWDLESGHTLRTLEGHKSYVTAVAVTPEKGRAIAISGSWDHALRVWDLESGNTLRMLEGHTGYVTGVAVTPDGRYAVSASYDQTVRAWDWENGEILATFTGDGSIFCCAAASGGLTICAGDDLARLHFLRLEGVGRRHANATGVTYTGW